jgi:hypothetical protein
MSEAKPITTQQLKRLQTRGLWAAEPAQPARGESFEACETSVMSTG